jgi:site-specific DNA-methyltransferase (adenine-specific)
MDAPKPRSALNQTIALSAADRDRLRSRLLPLSSISALPVPSGTLQGDCLAISAALPQAWADLLILDPPYNLSKVFNGKRFGRRSVQDYTDWLDAVICRLKPLLKETATVYICGDWFSSASIFTVAAAHFMVRNRITWERDKGRSAQANWKNASEDIWFCTVSESYTFNAQAVRQRRRVLAPYRDRDQQPKDWQSTQAGKFRDTGSSNLWTDITLPFWSMAENTPHPTQKSEKLIAKLLLASSQPQDFVLDPFVGSGTTSVVAKKLGRHYLGIEQDEEYCLLTEYRLEHADQDPRIQGWVDGVFWERNTFALQQHAATSEMPPRLDPKAGKSIQ